tara:strand:+ start:7472 stop:7855 length:384 start_codon:yes stop_codon:yes gene_type:complete
MESISHQDIHFLIALSASEESILQEIVWEFERWECQKEDVLVILNSLVKDGTVLLCKPIANSDFLDLTKEETLQAISTWDGLFRKDLMLFLTESGEKRWEVDDWGISTKRARHLMFSNSGNITRIDG